MSTRKERREYVSQVLLPKIASYCNHTRLAVATNSRILSFLACQLATFQQILLVIIFCNVKLCSRLSYTVVLLQFSFVLLQLGSSEAPSRYIAFVADSTTRASNHTVG
jgi:hypothetical protein